MSAPQRPQPILIPRAVVLLVFCLILLVPGCASSPRPLPSQIPTSLLEPCPLPDPAGIRTVGDLEDAFIVAWMCAKAGNDDKASIRELQKQPH